LVSQICLAASVPKDKAKLLPHSHHEALLSLVCVSAVNNEQGLFCTALVENPKRKYSLYLLAAV